EGADADADDEPAAATESIPASPPVAIAEPAVESPAPPVPADTEKPDARPDPNQPSPRWTAEQMQTSLLRVPEIALQPASVPGVLKTGRVIGWSHPLLAIVDARPDLHGL